MKVKRHCLLALIIFIFPVSCANAQKTDDEKIGDKLKSGIPVLALLYTFGEDKIWPTLSLPSGIQSRPDNAGPNSRFMLLKSLLASSTITLTLKDNIHKERPNGKGNRSFPSAHTSMAFTGAAFMHKRYGLTYSLPAYLGASYVAYSRVQSKNHYTEDVIAGALIGILTTFYFTDPNVNYILTPQVNDNGAVGISWKSPW